MPMTQKEAAKILRRNAPPGEFPAFINPREASWLKGMGGSGRKTKSGLRSFELGEEDFGGNTDAYNAGTGGNLSAGRQSDWSAHSIDNTNNRNLQETSVGYHEGFGQGDYQQSVRDLHAQTVANTGGGNSTGSIYDDPLKAARLAQEKAAKDRMAAEHETRTPQGPGSVTNPNDPYGIQQKIAEGAKGLIDKEYKAPTMTPEQRIAGVSDQTTQARDMAQDMVGTGKQAFADAAGVGQQVSQYDPNQVQAGNFLQGQQVSDYMSPHTDSVIKGMQDNAMRTMQKQRGALQAQHQMAGAGIGSRGALENAAMAAEVQRGLGQQVAGALEKSYAQAAGMKQSDMDRSMQAQRYNQQAGLAGQDVRLRGAQQQIAGTQAGRQAAAQDLGMVSQIGADVEGRNQNILDEKWADAQEKRNWGRDNLALASQIAGTMPTGSTTTTTGAEQYKRKNRLGSALAGAASGWLASGGNPWGAVAGGAAGFFG